MNQLPRNNNRIFAHIQFVLHSFQKSLFLIITNRNSFATFVAIKLKL
nr:MAG TPA: hypothetical protein [Caudoviricetes sp.]